MARSLNGSTQYLESTTAVVTGLPVTFSCWVYPTAISRFQAAMCISRATGAVDQDLLRLIVYNTNVIEAASFQATTPTVSTTIGTITANAWHHLAATFSSSGGQFVWLNGTKSSSGGNSRVPAGLDRTSIGRQIVNSTQFFPWQGRIAEAAVYSVVLDDAEIAAMADGYTPLQIRPQSLVAYYPLGGHYGQLDVDRWKNRYDLTAYNSPTWADHPRVIYPRRSFWFPTPIPAAPTSYTLEALPASVDVVGQSAALSAVRKLAAQPATIEVVGQEATLRVIRKIVASPATVDVVGQAATLSAVRRLAASPATIEVVGQAATLRVVRKIVASPATVDVVGQSATLTRARTLTANAAEVQVSGQAAGLTATRKITASPAAIEVVGQSANLRVVRRIVASPATVEVVGQTAVTRRTALLQGLAATIAVVGQAAVLTYSGEAAVVTEDWIGVDKATGRTPKATATHRVGTATAIGRVSEATAYQRPQ